MRVAFDLDDTVIPCGFVFPVERPRHQLLATVFRLERLRRGTRDLIVRLQAAGCDVWVYTTSHRSRLRIWANFRAAGVRISGIVNQTVHDRRVAELDRKWAKHPPTFGIDVLVDDSAGLAELASAGAFVLVVVDPTNDTWDDQVYAEVSKALSGAR